MSCHFFCTTYLNVIERVIYNHADALKLQGHVTLISPSIQPCRNMIVFDKFGCVCLYFNEYFQQNRVNKI